MLDYGDFYGSPQFKRVLPNFVEGQKEAAKKIWDSILGRCGVDIGMPRIDTIVDLGCGNGTLTVALANEAKTKLTKTGKSLNGSAEPTEFIGVDSSMASIRLAKRKIKHSIHTTFLQSDSGFRELFEKLKSTHHVNWSRTALVCLSHTWFHLEQRSLNAAVKKYRPVLLVIDVYHTWNATLAKLPKNSQLEQEEGRFCKEDGCVYWLATRRHPDKKGMVQRGIWRTPVKPSKKKGLEEGWLIAPTEQYAITSHKLFGKEPERDNGKILENARRLGSVTGEGGCDYVTRKVTPHTSGWGEMVCHALVPRNPRAVPVNRAYFKAVESIVNRLFVDPKEKNFNVLRSLLALYDESAKWKKATDCEGSREAMVVLPFDPHTNFARAISLFPTQRNSGISKHDLLLEAPTSDQLRFPTAYGLFHALEGRTSSPQAFPLEWAPNYDHAKVDLAFGLLEEELLGIRTSKGEKIEEGRDRGYFLLPVYFGSLPLFTLALRFPTLFPAESTDYQVYFSALSNLHTEIKVALTDPFIRCELLSTWIARALDELMQLEKSDRVETQQQKNDLLAVLLEQLESLLFGRSETSHVANSFKVAGMTRYEGVLSKDWKSWVLSVPSFSIRQLRSVEAENTRLWELWTKEKARVMMDHELRISYWFQEGRFFHDKGHESWIDRIHGECLRTMIQIVTHGGQLNDLHETTYFASSREHFLLRSLQERLRVLMDEEIEEAKKVECFDDLKAAYCKTLENTGEGIRFSWRRLGLHIYSGAKNAVPPEGEKSGKHLNQATIKLPSLINRNDSWCKPEGPDARYHCPGDPTVSIGELINAFNQLGCLKSVILERRDWSRGSGAGTITIKLRHTLGDAIGGCNLNRIRFHARALMDEEESVPSANWKLKRWLYHRTTLKIGLTFREARDAKPPLTIQCTLK